MTLKVKPRLVSDQDLKYNLKIYKMYVLRKILSMLWNYQLIEI